MRAKMRQICKLSWAKIRKKCHPYFSWRENSPQSGRRNTAVMSSHIDWSRVKVTDLQTTWAEIAPAISKLLFKNQLFVCTNIADARYYELMVCFFKDYHGLPGKLGTKIYHLLGHVSDVVKVR